jgi:hypothetical protein
MNPQENDPDTLQFPEESDPEWVNRWDDCKNKKDSGTKQLTFDVIDL